MQYYPTSNGNDYSREFITNNVSCFYPLSVLGNFIFATILADLLLKHLSIIRKIDEYLVLEMQG